MISFQLVYKSYWKYIDNFNSVFFQFHIIAIIVRTLKFLCLQHIVLILLVYLENHMGFVEL